MGQIAQCQRYQQFKQKALDRIDIDLCLSDKHFYLKLSWLTALFFDSSLSTFIMDWLIISKFSHFAYLVTK